jgi:hypothetical protein
VLRIERDEENVRIALMAVKQAANLTYARINETKILMAVRDAGDRFPTLSGLANRVQKRLQEVVAPIASEHVASAVYERRRTAGTIYAALKIRLGEENPQIDWKKYADSIENELYKYYSIVDYKTRAKEVVG